MVSNLFIIVLYADDLADCKTINSLRRLKNSDQIYLHFQINGTRDFSSELHDLFAAEYARVTCSFDGSNRGIVHAYQDAILRFGNECDWITLFDQDSVFDESWYDVLVDNLSYMQTMEVALAPRIMSAAEQISPFRVKWGRVISHKRKSGFPVCINSLTTFRASYLRRLAGDFPVRFFLDAFDVWLFYRIHRDGLGFRLLDVTLEHGLSLNEGTVSETMLARELMSLINTAQVSPLFIPMSLLRFIIRQVKLAVAMRSLRPFNLFATYSR